MGSALVEECQRRGLDWQRGFRDAEKVWRGQIKRSDLVINCAAFIPFPTVDACRFHKGETILGNVLWPRRLADACQLEDIPLVHLSTGCLFDEQREYSETDTPTRGWDGYCGFYVGTKLMAESIVSEWHKHYILRLRLPFDEFDHPRNYLTKLAKFEKVYDHVNSLTHRGDFAKWVLDLWEKKAPYGTYHCCNQDQVTAYDLVASMALRGLIPNPPAFVKPDGTTGARLSVDKLVNAGVTVRSVNEAVTESLKNWKPICSKP